MRFQKIFNKIKYLCFAGGCALLTAAPAALAQAFPAKPVRFIIGPAPELLPRLVGQKLAEQ